MATTTWLEKAERLRSELAHVRTGDAAIRESQERAVIASWLRSEFSDEPPPDTKTLALFPQEDAE